MLNRSLENAFAGFYTTMNKTMNKIAHHMTMEGYAFSGFIVYMTMNKIAFPRFNTSHDDGRERILRGLLTASQDIVMCYVHTLECVPKERGLESCHIYV